MATTYTNFLSGATTDNPLLIGATTINGTALSSMPAISAPDTMWLVLDPDGANGAPEIVQVTAHTASATSATIVRAQQSTTAREHPTGTVFRVAVTKSDLDELPFRKLTTRGDIPYASGANTVSRLAVGAASTVLKSDGTDPSWGFITAASLASNSVSTAKIVDANVTAAKMATDSVETAAIKDANVTTAKIADSNVTTGKIADAAVTYPKRSVTEVRLTKTGSCGTTEADVTGMTETADPDGLASSSVITLASDGWYAIQPIITAASTGLSRTLYLFVNIGGTNDTSLNLSRNTLAGGTLSTSQVRYLASGTTLKLRNYADSGGESADHTYQLNVLRLA